MVALRVSVVHRWVAGCGAGAAEDAGTGSDDAAVPAGVGRGTEDDGAVGPEDSETRFESCVCGWPAPPQPAKRSAPAAVVVTRNPWVYR